jgi:hypothetical protein
MAKPVKTPIPKETLLGVSAVYLFGRLVSDLKLIVKDDDDDLRDRRKGANAFLQKQMRETEAGFARIYYFAFEGGFFELARPAMFLVHGAGVAPDAPSPKDPNFERLSRIPGRMTRTGLAWQIGSFASDMKIWAYDKGDFSMRLDADTGTFEQLLLAAEGSGSAIGLSSGAMARSSGALARSSGVMARSSGAMPRRPGDLD